MRISDASAVVDSIDNYIKIKVQMELDLHVSHTRGYLEKIKQLEEARSNLILALSQSEFLSQSNG